MRGRCRGPVRRVRKAVSDQEKTQSHSAIVKCGEPEREIEAGGGPFRGGTTHLGGSFRIWVTPHVSILIERHGC
jgi:hypothetical protein